MTKFLLRRLANWAVLVLLALGLLTRLSAQDRGGPPHMGLSIGSGIPATLYLPGKLDKGQLALPKPPGQRPALVVVAHGYSADQRIMSPMARSCRTSLRFWARCPSAWPNFANIERSVRSARRI